MITQEIPSRKCLMASAIMALGLAAQPTLAAEVQLEEVIVTAERRAESLQDTPISSIVFNADSIENKGISTLIDLSNETPNLQMTNHPGMADTILVFVRAVGNNSSQVS